MSVFMDTLKARLTDSQRRLAEATRVLQQAQANHQMITQEVFGWQKAVEAETRKEAQDAALAAARAQQAPIPIQTVLVTPTALPSAQPIAAHVEEDKSSIAQRLNRACLEICFRRNLGRSLAQRLCPASQARWDSGCHHLPEVWRQGGQSGHTTAMYP